MIKAYRYELEFQSERLGIFTGQNKILGYLEDESIITNDESIIIKNEIYNDVVFMFDWLNCPFGVKDSKFYFTDLGDRHISKYINHLTEKIKEFGIKVIKIAKEISEDMIIYEDDHQYAIKID